MIATSSQIVFDVVGRSRDYTLMLEPGEGSNTSMCFLLTFDYMAVPPENAGMSPVPFTVNFRM